MDDEEIQNEEENEEEENTEILVPVFSTDHPGIIAVVKSMLDEAGIQYLVKGDGLQTLLALGTVQFFVTPDNEEMSRALLADVKESEPIIGESVPEDLNEYTDTLPEDFDEDSSLEDAEEK
jgi:hypothetical protein